MRASPALARATGGLSAKPGEAQVHELERFVIGEDPLQPERLYHRMYKGLFLGTNVGMCAIEIACWDILGKSSGFRSGSYWAASSAHGCAPTPMAGTRDRVIRSFSLRPRRGW